MLELERLGKTFGGLVAVRDISFRVGRGEIVSLIGPNGAGKTTCLNLVSGFYRPDRGSVRFEGRDVTGVKPYRMAQQRVVRTFQKTNVLKSLSARENIVASHYLAGRTPLWRTFFPGKREREAEQAIAESADEILDIVGLAARRDIPANSLSCGELRLLEVGVALGAKPRLLMLDEPAAGLNTHEAKALGALLRKIQGTKVEATLLVEHNMSLVMEVSDRVVVMNFGQKLAEGSPKEVQAIPAVREAYLGTAQ
jgi:branched-chain amino acid transport system ATP-binding protein